MTERAAKLQKMYYNISRKVLKALLKRGRNYGKSKI